MRVIPIILSGGSGTRLWPLSRASKPKQFLNFGTGHSLIQETALRCRSDIFDPRPIVVGADAHRFLLAQDLAEVGVAADILLEPETPAPPSRRAASRPWRETRRPWCWCLPPTTSFPTPRHS